MMKMLIAGASGLVGKSLVSDFSKKHEITVLGRDSDLLKKIFPNHHAITWRRLEKESATNYQLIINLCGESIAAKRWTRKQKAKIVQSRVETTKNLTNWVLTSNTPHLLRFLNASAVGIYGLNTTENTEDTRIAIQKKCFSQQIVREWESEVKEKLENKISYNLMRFGVVIKKHEGLLKKLELPYNLGLASILGNGQQAISWVHIEDLVRAIDFIINTPTLTGAVNIVAPDIVSQKKFAKTLAKTLHRPCFLKTPSCFIKIFFGQMGQELLLSGQAVISKKLKESGFSFYYPTLEKALFQEYNFKH
jgi:hypothetical protein